MNSFEEWMDGFEQTTEYKNDSFIWSDMAKVAYLAGIPRAAEIAESLPASLCAYAVADAIRREDEDGKQ